MQEANNNGEEGVKFVVVLHSHENSVPLIRSWSYIYLYDLHYYSVQAAIITNGFLLRDLQRGVIFIKR